MLGQAARERTGMVPNQSAKVDTVLCPLSLPQHAGKQLRPHPLEGLVVIFAQQAYLKYVCNFETAETSKTAQLVC